MKKIGFCFLIYDEIHLEDIWNRFFSGVDPNKYGIYIHYKTQKPLQYFEKYKLTNCIETEYGKVSIVHAHNLLFKRAYEDECFKIISLSQACIPFKSFDYIYNFLCKDDYGHFNISPHIQCFPRASVLLNYYDQTDVQKSSNWFILNRKICERCVSTDKTKIESEYASVVFPEEYYFITTVFHNHLQDTIIGTPNLSNDATTFTNWLNMNYKYRSCSGLKNYETIEKEELMYLLQSKCLFGRKFLKKCYSDLYVEEYLTRITSANQSPVSEPSPPA